MTSTVNRSSTIGLGKLTKRFIFCAVFLDSGAPLLISVSRSNGRLIFVFLAAITCASGIAASTEGLGLTPIRRIHPAGLLLLAVISAGSIQGITVGLLRENSTSLILGDLFRHLLTLYSLLLGFKLHGYRRLLVKQYIHSTLIKLEMARIGLFAILLLTTGNYSRIGGASALTTGLIIGYLVDRSRNDWLVKDWHIAVVLVGLTLPLIRSLWIVALVQLLIASRWINFKAIWSAVPSLAPITAIAIIVFLFPTDTFDRIRDPILHRFETLVALDQKNDTSFSSRELERSFATKELSALQLPEVGAGFGALFITHSGELEHQIHDTGSSLKFRLGDLGSATWFAFTFSSVVLFIKSFRPSSDLGATIGAIGIVISSTQFYGLVGVFIPAIAIAMSLSQSNDLVENET